MKHITKLEKLLQSHFKEDKRRIRFISLFVVSLIRVRSVKLSSLTSVFNPKVKEDSNYKRMQRFFRDFTIDYTMWAKFMVSALPVRSFILTLDRTNWQFGKKDINILCLSIIYKNSSIPLCWDLLNKRGNSSFEERKEIISKAISILGKERIKCLIADREFGSGNFFRYLKKSSIEFHVRIKKTSIITKYKTKVSEVTSMISNFKAFKYIVIPGKKIVYNEEVYLSGMKTKGDDYMIIASSSLPEEAQGIYKQRWTIENLFGNMKTRGFNLEQTHMNKPERLKKLLALVALALLWCYLTGLWIEESIRIRIKNHGRKEKSTFRKGIDYLCLILNSINKLIFEFDKALKVLSCT